MSQVTAGLSVRFLGRAAAIDPLQKQIIVGLLITQFQMRRGNLVMDAVGAVKAGQTPQAETYHDACMQALLQVRQFAQAAFTGLDLEITYDEPVRGAQGQRPR